MIIPKQIKIGAHLINIEVCEIPGGHDGEYCNEINTIKINQKLPPDQQEATLIHEILHACNAVIGESEIFHALLDSLSEQLYQVLKDNQLHF